MSNYPDGMTSADHAYLDGYSGCLHEDVYVEDARVCIPVPKNMKERAWVDFGSVIIEHRFEVEGLFVCSECSKSKWVSIDIDSYILNLDDNTVFDD